MRIATVRRRRLKAVVAVFLVVAATLGVFASVTYSAFSNAKREATRSDVEKAEQLCERKKWKEAYRLADSVVVAIRANEYDERGTQTQIREFQGYLTRAGRTLETCASHFSTDASSVDEDETLIFEF